MRQPAVSPVPVLLAALLAGCNRSGPDHSQTPAAISSADDSAFAGVQRRGRVAMGVDQYTSAHRFDPLPDGGQIILTRNSADPAGVKQIRAHMADIAAAFRRGDFSTTVFVHEQAVPGTATMAARRDRISYRVDTLPRGGSLGIHSTDSAAVEAIHQFLAFQRRDHRTSHDGSH